MDRDDPDMSILRQAELLGISRSSLYYEGVRGEENVRIMHAIDEIFTKRPIYGIRRLRHDLRDNGFFVGRERISALMKEMGLQAIYPKKHCCTSSPDKAHKKYPYLLRNTRAAYPNHIWGTDITYIRLEHGFCYLVAIIDWYSRYVLAWGLSPSLDASFCVDTLKQALATAVPYIHNSDQGCQFTSADYTEVLAAHDVRISMDGRGRCFDNIFTERLWRTVKYEDVYLKDYRFIPDVHAGLSEYFPFYNTERKHQALGYETPETVYFGG